MLDLNLVGGKNSVIDVDTFGVGVVSSTEVPLSVFARFVGITGGFNVPGFGVFVGGCPILIVDIGVGSGFDLLISWSIEITFGISHIAVGVPTSNKTAPISQNLVFDCFGLVVLLVLLTFLPKTCCDD
ncbi:hypothetical protein CBF18_16410 [Mastigocladus laminosus WC112]|nr:hypothetical protein CBF18_16410 [Mastigocladus laminosus WC112]